MARMWRRRRRFREASGSARIELGETSVEGVAPSMYALLDRGIGLRPELAVKLRGTVVFRFDEGFAPLLVRFGEEIITVSDEDCEDPDLTIFGPLPGVVHFATAPQFGGIPNPATGEGRKALRSFVSGRVRIEGELTLARSLLMLLAL